MQAKDIQVDKVYAIRQAGEMHRFQAVSIISVRGKSSTKSFVVGLDLDAEDKKKEIKVEVDQIQGTFEQFLELKKREEQERAKFQAERAAAAAELQRRRALLYEKLGVECPPKADEQDQLFHIRYGSEVTITKAGWEALIAYLEAH